MNSLIEDVARKMSLIVLAKRVKSNPQFFSQQFARDSKSNICSDGHRRALKGSLIHIGNIYAHNSRLSDQCLEATNARRNEDNWSEQWRLSKG
jgi:hypothetical protein